MKPTFRGFQEQPNNTSTTSTSPIESTSEISEYDSTVSSRETTPTQEGQESQTVKKASTVRRLIDHFSASDSDTTEVRPAVTRRKKSKTSEHIEIPLGGEKELRRRMAAQTKADNAVKFFKALHDDMTETLNEADRDLSANVSRNILLGHLEGIKAAEVEVAKVWQRVEECHNNGDVELDMVALMRLKNKQNTRCFKLKGHIAAATEPATSGASPTTGTIQVVNPPNFGNLKLPDFYGDYTEFDNFQSVFKKLIANGNLDEGGKLAHLLNHVLGEAKDYLGSDGLNTKTYDEVWDTLKEKYGKPWRITRAAVKKLMNIEKPQDDPKDLSRYWNQINEACKVAERLKLTATSVILNMGLLNLPVEFRSKMDDKLKPQSKDFILTRKMTSEPFNDIIAGEVEKPSKIHATLGFNTLIQPNGYNSQSNIPPQQKIQNQNKQPNSKTRQRGGVKYHYCLLCSKKQGNNHKTWQCPVYSTGTLAKERMRLLNRCSQCAVPLTEHGSECSHRVHCNIHPQQRHTFWLCQNWNNNTVQQQQQQPPQNSSWQGQPSQQQYQQQQYSWQNVGQFSNTSPQQV